MNDLPLLFASLSLVFSGICLIAIIPLLAKVFFSTHVREFLPIEEYAQIRKGLKNKLNEDKGLPPTPPLDEDDAEELKALRARLSKLHNQFWNGGEESLEPLSRIRSIWEEEDERGQPS